MKKNWLQTNTFHHTDFTDLGLLVEKKQEKGLKISLCLPTLNEEETVGKEIVIMKSELTGRYPLLDEIIVMDSGSKDRTVEVAEHYGADVYLAEDVLPELEPFRGKGENLWKSLYVSRGDIIIYLDTDIKNIHHRFAYALIGPLLLNDDIKFSKAFYDRPIYDDDKRLRRTGGGRVTELVTRPLFSLFLPELTQIIQPLSGEYGGYRDIFEKLPFPIGYGIETSMIIDICERWGIDVIAQVDLDRRVHRHQTTVQLGRMSFAIMECFFDRISDYGLIDLNEGPFYKMIQYQRSKEKYNQETYDYPRAFRPPMIEIPEYRDKFGIRNS